MSEVHARWDNVDDDCTGCDRKLNGWPILIVFPAYRAHFCRECAGGVLKALAKTLSTGCEA